jgi:lipopolysaccharide transport system ATP-binding protein
MAETVVQVENLGKSYRLGTISSGTLRDDIIRFFTRKHPELDSRKVKNEIVWALKDLSFDIQKGDAVGIVGKNGAGKSTLLKILSRTTAPTTGQIKIKGKIASLLEVGTGFHPELTGRENIFLNGAIMGMTKRDIKAKFDEIVEFSGVSRYIDTPVKRYSSGMYVRLAFAVAAHLESEIMIIDEVLAVGDIDFQKKCLAKMGEVTQKQGRTVLFVSHNMSSVKALCNTGIFLESGRLKLKGSVNEVVQAYTVANKGLVESTELAQRKDRSGNGLVRVVDYYVTDANGNRLETILTGEAVSFHFQLQAGSEAVRNVDVGLNFFDPEDRNMGVLYSSYYQHYYTAGPHEAFLVTCTIPKFPFSLGNYKVGLRITVNNEEADWLLGGVGYINVENGDFYGTGSPGFSHHHMTNFEGIWTVDN